MEKIIIEKDADGLFIITQFPEQSTKMGWDEMMGLTASLTMPEPRPCLQWMQKIEIAATPDDPF